MPIRLLCLFAQSAKWTAGQFILLYLPCPPTTRLLSDSDGLYQLANNQKSKIKILWSYPISCKEFLSAISIIYSLQARSCLSRKRHFCCAAPCLGASLSLLLDDLELRFRDFYSNATSVDLILCYELIKNILERPYLLILRLTFYRCRIYASPQYRHAFVCFISSIAFDVEFELVHPLEK
jgi:hypothetical protein